MERGRISTIWRLVRRYGRLLAPAALLLFLAVALLAAMPIAAELLAAGHLRQSVREMPAALRHLTLTGASLNDRSAADVDSALGPLLRERVVVRQANLSVRAEIGRETGVTLIPPTRLDFLRVDLFAMDGLEEHTVLRDGRRPVFPANGEPEGLFEAAIGSGSAARLGLAPGDRLLAGDGRWQFVIVGLVDPIDPADERWYGSLRPFTGWERVSLDPDFVEVTVGLLLPPAALAEIAPEQVSWRVLVDPERLETVRLDLLAANLRRLAGSLTAEEIRLSSQLTAALDRYEQELAAGRLLQATLITQSLLILGLLLVIVGQLLAVLARPEIALVRSRGFTPWQASRPFLLPLAFLAFGLIWPLGVGAAALAAGAWLGMVAPFPLPAAWLLGGGAALLGWILLCGPLAALAGRELEPAALVERPAAGEASGRWLAVDLAILAAGGLIMAQLGRVPAGSENQEAAAGLDPLLLLGPTLLLLGAGLLLHRLLPPLLRVVARVLAGRQGTLWPLGAAWAAREEAIGSRIVVLIGLATALSLYDLGLLQALQTAQAAVAQARSGADIRLEIPAGSLVAWRDYLDGNPTVAATAPVYRGQLLSPDSSRPVQFLAFEPAGMGAVLQSGFDFLAPDGSGTVPALISRVSILGGVQPADVISLRLGPAPVPLEIRGVVDRFPTLSPPFVVGDLESFAPLEGSLGADARQAVPGRYELWVALIPGQAAAPADLLAGGPITPEGSPAVLSDSAALRRQFAGQITSRLLAAASALNIAFLVALSAAGLLAGQLLEGWRRRPALASLRALGFSSGDLRRLLLARGMVIIGLGLLLGGLGALVLSRLSGPLFSALLSASVEEAVAASPAVHWPPLLPLAGGLVALYSLVLAGAAWAISRFDLNPWLRWRGE